MEAEPLLAYAIQRVIIAVVKVVGTAAKVGGKIKTIHKINAYSTKSKRTVRKIMKRRRKSKSSSDDTEFKKIKSSATVSNKWRIATQEEAKENISTIVKLMKQWDICQLADGYAIDGAGHGNNITGP